MISIVLLKIIVMKKNSNLLSGIIGLLFMLGSLYLLYKLSIIAFENVDKIDINILLPIIGGTITICSFFITRYLERKKIIELEIRNKKIPIYEEFFTFYFKAVLNQDTESQLTQAEMINFLRDFNKKAIIWFPDHILKSYIQWKDNLVGFSQNNGISLKEIFLHQEQFMCDIRKDIGHSNKDLITGSIISLFINDFHTLK